MKYLKVAIVTSFKMYFNSIAWISYATSNVILVTSRPSRKFQRSSKWTPSLTSFSVNNQTMDDDVLTTLKILIIGESGVGKSRWGPNPLFFLLPFCLSRTVGWVVNVSVSLIWTSKACRLCTDFASSIQPLNLTFKCCFGLKNKRKCAILCPSWYF